MSRAFPSLELDTVVEERSDPEPEATVIEMMTPDKDSDSQQAVGGVTNSDRSPLWTALTHAQTIGQVIDR